MRFCETIAHLLKTANDTVLTIPKLKVDTLSATASNNGYPKIFTLILESVKNDQLISCLNFGEQLDDTLFSTIHGLRKTMIRFPKYLFLSITELSVYAVLNALKVPTMETSSVMWSIVSIYVVCFLYFRQLLEL